MASIRRLLPDIAEAFNHRRVIEYFAKGEPLVRYMRLVELHTADEHCRDEERQRVDDEDCVAPQRRCYDSADQ